MKHTLIVFAITCLYPIMAFDVMTMDNLNGQYNGKDGSARIDQFKFYTPEFGAKANNARVTVERVNNNYYMNYRDTYFVYKTKKESLINGINKLFFSNVTVNYEPGEIFQLKSGGIELYQQSGSQKIPRFTLKCRKLKKTKSIESELINPCLDAASLEIPSLSLRGLSAQKVENIIGNKITLETLKNINLNIYKKSFSLTLKADYIFNWQIKSSGTIRYLAKSSELELKINKAKAGIFNVKKRLLKELSKAGVDSLRIIGDRIFIKL